jgi:hypothetical protein
MAALDGPRSPHITIVALNSAASLRSSSPTTGGGSRTTMAIRNHEGLVATRAKLRPPSGTQGDIAFDEISRAIARSCSRAESLKLVARLVAVGLAGGVATACDGGNVTACTMPSDPSGCVRLGGGASPWYFEGWVCPVSDCSNGFCSGRALGGTGKCAPTAPNIHQAVTTGEFRVLESHCGPGTTLCGGQCVRACGGRLSLNASTCVCECRGPTCGDPSAGGYGCCPGGYCNGDACCHDHPDGTTTCTTP